MNDQTLKIPRDRLINQTSYKYVRSVIYLGPLINVRCQQGCIDHVTFLHMDSTVHWCTHDYKTKFTVKLLNTSIIANFGEKYIQMQSMYL